MVVPGMITVRIMDPKIILVCFEGNFAGTNTIADETAAAMVIVVRETKTEFRKF